MNYVIVAKDEFLGTSNSDVANPLKVTEIASELIITRLHVISLLNTNQIDKTTTTVVTIEERKGLYTEIFENVISYSEFREITLEENDHVLDLLQNDVYDNLAIGGGLPYYPFYQNFERDRKEILKIRKSSLDGYNLKRPFVCLVIRKRGAWAEKNLSDTYWKNLIDMLISSGIQCFVFGKETEIFCDGNSVQQVKNYQDWCTLVQNSNCRLILSTMTGGVYPALIFGSSGIDLILIDNTSLMSKHKGDPSFFADCINFSGVKIEFIDYIPETNELYERVREHI